MGKYLAQIRFACKYISDVKWKYFPALLGVGLGYSGMSITISLIPQVLIDAAVDNDFSNIKSRLLLYGILFCLSAAVSVISQYLYRSYALKASAGLRKRIMEKRTKLPMEVVESEHSGEMVSRMVYDMNKIEELYRTKFKEFVNPVLALITSVIPMLLLNVPLTLILLIVSTLCLFINTTFSGKVKQAGLSAAASNDALTKKTSDILAGILTIKQYQLRPVLAEKYKTANQDYTEKSMAKVKISAWLEAMNKGFDILCTIVFLVAGSIMVHAGKTTYGTLVALMSLESSLIWAALQAGKRFPELFENIASVERIENFLALKDEMITVPDRDINPESASYIEFQNVAFGYPGRKKVLKNFNLKLQENDSVVVTGPSGCGKSTLCKLLMGFYNIQEGTIFVKGKVISDYEPDALHDMITYIPQKPFLFNDTLFENIRCVRPEASEEEVISAARAANADDFIRRLPGEYNYIPGEQGKKLSFGQRQRIAIARAFLKDAPIILFDEVVSGLDYESERAICEAVSVLIKEKTAIIITHRNADAWHAKMRIDLNLCK
ncbi:MAG: ABC transporter ATP-binding protein/permease [Acetatifactor sp.]|nr:ABC transporter ATP-binding protein/permease [Acetatifactor sp.]